MKVLFISPHRDGTGYSHAAIDNILAMDKAGINVVPRPIKLNKHLSKLPERIIELEEQSPQNCDVVIQYTLPEMMEYSGHFKKNIAMYCSETSNFSSSSWPQKLNTMDIGWVASKQMLEAAKASNVNIPLKVIPYPADVSKFERSYKPIRINEIEETFTFYTIAEMNKRKNLKSIIQAFHSEFDPSEPVSLLVKTHKYGMDSNETRKHVEADCERIKESLKLHSNINHYKKEIIITDMLTDESLYRLHSTCDCFVLTSFGEAWGIPAFDAMGFGKTPIVTNWGGFKEFISNDTGWLVDFNEEQVYGITEGFNDLYTGRESWASVNIGHLRKCMREAYSNNQLRSRKAELGMTKVYDFSYELVGSLIKKELESYVSQK